MCNYGLRKCLDLEVVWLRATTAWQKHRAREKHHVMKHSVMKKRFALTLVPDINVIRNCYKKYQTGWWIRHVFSLATSVNGLGLSSPLFKWFFTGLQTRFSKRSVNIPNCIKSSYVFWRSHPFFCYRLIIYF